MKVIILIAMLATSTSYVYKQNVDYEEIYNIFELSDCIEGYLMAGSIIQSNTENEAYSSSTKSQNIELSININDKDKTPMCLVNELARFNKIKHQYKLTNEQGPPHKKKFTVTLQLGNEEYNADAMSIKKAQHAAAALALTKTNYKQPQTKMKLKFSDNITPTVELNALAMKRGEQTTYTIIETPQYVPTPAPLYNGFRPDLYSHARSGSFNNYTNFGSRGPRCMPYIPNYYSSRFTVSQVSTPYIKPELKSVGLYKVKLQIGKHEFIGQGNTNQSARHDAALKALTQIKNEEKNENIKEVLKSGDSKSVISQVYEVALKMKLPIKFEVLKEDGLPHMKTYVTKCSVGSYNATGEGNGKKISKRRAAEKMLQTLKEANESILDDNSTSPTLPLPKNRYKMPRKKNRNLIKETKQNSENVESINNNTEDTDPVAKLYKIQALKKAKEPLYTFKDDILLPNRRKEFIFEVTIDQHTAIGKGPNKKVAKRNAAEKLLIDMGLESELKERPIKNNDSPLESHENKTNFDSPKKNGRQIAPGVLLVLPETSVVNKPNEDGIPLVSVASNMASDLSVTNIRPSKQLDYFSKMLGFKVQYSDFPKGNHKDYLTLVSLSTIPPQICHGSGTTLEQSQDAAALNAISSLINLNLQGTESSDTTQRPVNGFSIQQNHFNNKPITRLS
ncbi:double-stranded RNA-binding protein Staufen homolog 2 isoform X1 [Daktulosphaira vitifoliae]|uniref:double-stranded RNA-binding protein Staufen homolog 2 isoform X1 n=1 Tax=Daktulosphaira vitifoliae TaxID=58002 RepID=UPI0021A99CE6|nr:double-stranded RNA-binding protein Staufen homolog 2 isoform X1 [Daktulosphaira vitifoliae]